MLKKIDHSNDKFTKIVVNNLLNRDEKIRRKLEKVIRLMAEIQYLAPEGLIDYKKIFQGISSDAKQGEKSYKDIAKAKTQDIATNLLFGKWLEFLNKIATRYEISQREVGIIFYDLLEEKLEFNRTNTKKILLDIENIYLPRFKQEFIYLFTILAKRDICGIGSEIGHLLYFMPDDGYRHELYNQFLEVVKALENKETSDNSERTDPSILSAYFLVNEPIEKVKNYSFDSFNARIYKSGQIRISLAENPELVKKINDTIRRFKRDLDQ